MGGTGRKQSENLQGGTVIKRLSFDFENENCSVKHKKKEAANHKTPESGKSGSPGISEQTGKRKKIDSGTVPQEKVRKVLSSTRFQQQTVK